MGNKRTEKEKALKDFKKIDYTKLQPLEIFIAGFNRGFEKGRRFKQKGGLNSSQP